MEISFSAKTIKIGTSTGVILPASALKQIKVTQGEEVEVTLSPKSNKNDQKIKNLMQKYEDLRLETEKALRQIS